MLANTQERTGAARAAYRPRPEVRAKVAELLLKSPSFAKLPREKRDKLANEMTQIADYLAAPESVPGNTLANGLRFPAGARAMTEPPPQMDYGTAADKVAEIGKEDFKAGAATAGARIAGQYMKQVKFVDFVTGLVEGVFHSIVQSSIEQMEAYGKLVSNVAMSLNQFRDENVTENQGRDQVVEQFPDLFEIGTDDFGDGAKPRLKLKEDVDESAALRRVQQGFGGEGSGIKSVDVSDENAEARIVLAARNQLATSRQQLLATLVMMGINRIVVTDGRISAKIMYDFQAKDSRRLSRSAAAYDYARNKDGNLATTWESEGEYENKGDDSYSRQDDDEDRSSNYYAKGKYKYTQKPIMSAMSTASDTQDSQLSVKASLAGAVELNFKSDYLPLEKMASPGMIAAIQMNSRPVDPNVLPSAPAGTQAPAASTAPAPGTSPQSPATRATA